MQIKQIVIEGPQGEVVIQRTDTGATVTGGDSPAEVDRGDDGDESYLAAYGAAGVLFGATPYFEPNTSNATIHDIRDLIKRVAGI